MATQFASNTYTFGDSDNDTLQSGNMGVLIGLGGNDILESTSSGALLAGTDGNDRYIANGTITKIVDTTGDDTVVLPSAQSAYIGGLIDNQHLMLFDEWSGDITLILNFKGAGRIEHFETAYGESLNADQVEFLVKRDGYSLSWSDMAEAIGTSAAEVEALAEINSVVASLDWAKLFKDLANADNTDPVTVARLVNAQAQDNLLSNSAKALWNESGAQTALANSEFVGLESNIPFDITPATYDQTENIALLYEGALDRRPDESGLNYWVDQFERGMSLEGIARRFIDSSEFKTRFNVNGDADFIDQTYQNVLGRTPDGGGRDWWLNELASGTKDHADVLIGFSVSPESEENATWLTGLHEASEGYWSLMG